MSVDLEERPGTNIKSIAIPEASKKSDLPYDPRTDLGPKEWEWIDRQLKKGLKTGESDGLRIEEIKGIAIIDSSRLARYRSLEVWQALRNDIDQHPGIPHRLLRIATAKLFDPQRYVANPIVLSDEISRIKTHYELNQPGLNIHDALIIAESVKILSLSSHEDFTLSQQHWTLLKEHVKDLKTWGNWVRLAQVLSHVKIIDPQRLNEFNLAQADWENIWRTLKETMDEFRLRSFDQAIAVDMFVDKVATASILAAKEVKITQEGIKLIFGDEEADKTTSPVPTAKKF